MEKKQKEIIVVGALAVVFIFAWANTFKFFGKRPKSMPSAAIESLAPDQTAREPAFKPEFKKEESDQAYNSIAWGRDPFSGKIYSSSGETVNLELQGIFWDQNAPQALIGDEIVSEGQIVGQYKVIKIYKDHVLVSDGKKEINLNLEK